MSKRAIRLRAGLALFVLSWVPLAQIVIWGVGMTEPRAGQFRAAVWTVQFLVGFVGIGPHYTNRRLNPITATGTSAHAMVNLVGEFFHRVPSAFSPKTLGLTGGKGPLPLPIFRERDVHPATEQASQAIWQAVGMHKVILYSHER